MKLKSVNHRAVNLGGFTAFYLHKNICIIRIKICLYLILLHNSIIFSQDVVAHHNGNLYNIEFTSSYCECEHNLIGESLNVFLGVSFCPNGNLIALNGLIYLIDPTNGNSINIFNDPGNLPPVEGLICLNDSIYIFGTNENNATLFQLNINSGVIENLGILPFGIVGELCYLNGVVYASVEMPGPTFGVAIIDINDPSNSYLIFTFPSVHFFDGLTASPFCNTLLGIDIFNDSVYLINIIDGSLVPVCSVLSGGTWRIASIFEHLPPSQCQNLIDLDCNDSSGATDADFNGLMFTCLSSGVGIADNDISIFIDDIITSMTVEVTPPMPDAPHEVLVMTGVVPLINVTGSGSSMIELTNAGGANMNDFKEALGYILYQNISAYPTGGLRSIEVQFTTASGMVSNIATAFINVVELPLTNVDLGPDQQICEGETITFNAGNFGASYLWSNGATSQSITTGIAGQYIVTVTTQTSCPNQDTVLLDVIPIIHVSLGGDSAICDNEVASITIFTDALFPITIEITPDPGMPFMIPGITGNHTFSLTPGELTQYTITNIISSQDACIETANLTHWVDVYATFEHDEEVLLCEGDSIFIGFDWETEAGQYQAFYESILGCDSLVSYDVILLPAEEIFLQFFTCDPSEAGNFITHLNNPNGCDTVIHTTVTLLESDTTLFFQTTCNQSASGIFQSTLTNILGCDSVIITTISLIPDPDTTVILQMTCDSSELGSMLDILADINGCDSIVVAVTQMTPGDTTYASASSCDSMQLGVFENFYTNQSGCDSLVITTVEYSDELVTNISANSCDPTEVGIVSDTLMSSAGCDSIVITTTSLVTSYMISVMSLTCDESSAGTFIDTLQSSEGCDSIVTETILFAGLPQTNLSSTTCDPSSSGIFIDTLVSQYGCDSIVTLTVDLLPLSDTQLTGTTCTSSEAGVFITTHLNQYGCDSTVTLTISLVHADTATLESFTCDPSMTGSMESLFTNIDGCDSLVISTIALYPLPQLDLVVTSDYNGYSISCYGESDGSASANVNGSSPWTYLWSTSDMTQNITGLSAGNYAVTVTDRNGCTAVDNVVLSEPPPFDIILEITHPDCFDGNKGEIRIQQIGGIEPIRYSIDGTHYQSNPVFGNLTGGTYQVSAIDANDCQVNHILWINVPLMVNVELGDNQILFPGDTAIIQAVVNVPYDSLSAITWTGLINANCPTCLTQAVAPVITTTYSVSVTSHDGCMDEDAITLFLEQNNDIYVPNVFSPNGDNINDVLLISAAPQIERIASFHLYDRWGDLVFSKDNFLPNDPQHAWDGISRGKPVNPGVFVYRMIIEVDGKQEVRYGDVTVVR